MNSSDFLSSYYSNLNFTAIPGHEDDDSNQSRKKTTRDPMSHRIIEKRRRDRMNNCLADLSRLIPTSYLKKSRSFQGRGRVEKTEIIEMAIKHLKHLQAHKNCTDANTCELSNAPNLDEEERRRHYRLGYQECLSEAVRFLVEIEGLLAGDGICRRLMDHLQIHMENLDNDCDDMASESSKMSAPSEFLNIKKMQIECDSESRQPVASQLREMLECQPMEKSANSPVASQSVIASTTVSHSRPNSSPTPHEVYKFKKEIKDRFQADLKQNSTLIQEVNLQSISSPTLSKSTTPSINVDDQAELGSNSSLSSQSVTSHSSGQRSNSSGYSSQSQTSNGNSRIPVFALHPNGQFYIPLTLESSVILPYLGKDEESFPILHPVNIAVNFSYQTPSLWPQYSAHFSINALNIKSYEMNDDECDQVDTKAQKIFQS